MVHFGELRDKAEGLIAGHSDQIKQGLDKVGDFVGNKVGHDKVNPVQEKLAGLIDSVGRDKPTPPEGKQAPPAD